MKFILASKSSRRKKILSKINLDFKIFNSQLMEKDITETIKAGQEPNPFDDDWGYSGTKKTMLN